MTAERCLLCDRPRCDDGSPVMMQDDAFCYFVGGSNCDRFAIDWRARALAAEASAASWEHLHDLACQNVAHADEEGESAREYARWSSRRHQAMADIARRALVEGLAECERLRGFLAAKLTQHERAIRADAAREEREAVVRDLRTNCTLASMSSYDIGRVADYIERLPIRRGDHAKGGR